MALTASKNLSLNTSLALPLQHVYFLFSSRATAPSAYVQVFNNLPSRGPLKGVGAESFTSGVVSAVAKPPL